MSFPCGVHLHATQSEWEIVCQDVSEFLTEGKTSFSEPKAATGVCFGLLADPPPFVLADCVSAL